MVPFCGRTRGRIPRPPSARAALLEIRLFRIEVLEREAQRRVRRRDLGGDFFARPVAFVGSIVRGAAVGTIRLSGSGAAWDASFAGIRLGGAAFRATRPNFGLASDFGAEDLARPSETTRNSHVRGRHHFLDAEEEGGRWARLGRDDEIGAGDGTLCPRLPEGKPRPQISRVSAQVSLPNY